MFPSENIKLHNSEIIPVIKDSDLFDGHDDNRFALGVFSSEDVLSYEKNGNQLIEGYLQLRANVYIDQANILGEESRRYDGTELDSYDERSVHFVVFEKKLGGAAVVASMRLIVKEDFEDLLPIEKTFNGTFPISLEKGSVEVSRFISRNENDAAHREAKSRTILAALAHIYTNEYGPVVAEMERRLKKSLGMFGIKSEILGPSTFVEEGGRDGGEKHTTELIAVEILTDSIEKTFGRSAIDDMAIGIGNFTFWGNLIDDGEKDN